MEKDVYKILDDLNIKYEKMEHEAVYTSAAAMFITETLGGQGVKNLFLKNKKHYYLVMIPEDERANVKYIEKQIGDRDLTFAKENYLKEVLDLTPGSVSPFGIVNDKDNKVKLVIDERLVGKDVLFHPNINTRTLKISYGDLIKFIESQNHKYVILKENTNE